MKYIYLGKIVNTHGLKGEVRLLSDFKYKEKVLKKYFKIYIGKEKIEEVINSYRPHKQFDLITIEGIEHINDVYKYKGKPVYVKKEDIELEEGQYFDDDLIGLKVMINGKEVGTVVNVEQAPYQDKIIVNKEGIEYLVPYVYGIIKNINLKEQTITLEDIKGLLGD